MKIETNEINVDFQPFSVNLTFETKQEVINLLALLQHNGAGEIEYTSKAPVLKTIDGGKAEVNLEQLSDQMGKIYYALLNKIIGE